MARTYQTVDNKRGYAFVVFAREYEKHRGYGWFAALVNVGGAPSKWDWMAEALARYDAVAEPDDPHDLANAIVKDMSQGLYADNRHRLRHIGPNGAQRVVVMDVPTDPGLLPREGDSGGQVGNPAAEILVRRIAEHVRFSPSERAVFDAMWETGVTSAAALSGLLDNGLDTVRVQRRLREIREKVKTFGNREA